MKEFHKARERIKVPNRGGGYICNADHVIKRETPPQNVIALYDVIKVSAAQDVPYKENAGCTL
jgi:hypothetical protein